MNIQYCSIKPHECRNKATGKPAKFKAQKKKHTEQEHRNAERANRLNHRNTDRELKTH